MSAAKKKISSASAPHWLGSLFSWLWGSGRPVFLVALLIGAFGGGAYVAWIKLGPRIINAPEYHLVPERVEITPLPDWIHRKNGEFQMEVFRNALLDGQLRITDDDLIDLIAKAFSQNPWVAKVQHVTKHHPASVKVELTYRKPVCMVEVPGGLLPVDAQGVLLPSTSEDFSSLEATRYPRLKGVDRGPTTPPGRLWIDAKVIGGAEIAAALADVWTSMELDHIVALPEADVGATASGSQTHWAREPVFAIFTQRGTRILWGHAPRAKNITGETPTAGKVAYLKHRLSQDDTLDGPQGQPRQLDLRTLPTST
jgi:hypothetical protein